MWKLWLPLVLTVYFREADVQKESEQQNAIYELAKQNAVNVLTALINPIVEQLGTEYSIQKCLSFLPIPKIPFTASFS